MKAPMSLRHHHVLRQCQHRPILLSGRANHTVSVCLGRRTILTGATATGSAVTGLSARMGLRAPPPPSTTTKFSGAAASSSSSFPSPLSAQSPLQRTVQIAKHLQGSVAPASHRPLSTMASSPYTVRKIAPANTLEHRIYIEKDGVPVSPFHDIPLYANQEQTILNMVVEIPRWTNGKLEVCGFRLTLLQLPWSCAR